VDELAQSLLVHGVAERPQERDRDGFDTGVQQALDRGPGGLLVQCDEHVTVPVDALGDLQREFLGEQRMRLVLAHHVLQLIGRAPQVATFDIHDEDRVAMPDGGEEADLGDVAGD